MKKILITGSAGLVGVACTEFFCKRNYKVIGIDNNQRACFFGNEASIQKNLQYLKDAYKNYQHFSIDIRDFKRIYFLDYIFIF